MAYTNAIFHIDQVSGSDAARAALTVVTASNPSGTTTRMNKVAHGLVTGAVVDLTLFTSWLNGAWKVVVFDADNFDLADAVWQATADASGTATPRGGSSLADAWFSVQFGATSARIANGDEIRFKESPAPTLVGDATWTYLNAVVTLAAPVTAEITNCETAWTASANVTSSLDTSIQKQGTNSEKLVFAAGFATGKAAYLALSALDLTAYEQVSFWIRSSGIHLAGVWELRLCSDAIGDTPIHTIPVPAMPGSNSWQPCVVDLAAAMSSGINSISLYALSDPGTPSVYLDNVIACKASASADALTHHSLIGKVHNLYWINTTLYATDEIRKPSPPNRNGCKYKALIGGTSAGAEPVWPIEEGATVVDGTITWICIGLEDTWHAIQSISGTTVYLDNGNASRPSTNRGYSGETETVSTYKREPILQVPVAAFATSNTIQKQSSNPLLPIIWTGGWDATAMSAQTGETWLSGVNCQGNTFSWPSLSSSYMKISGFGGVRYTSGLRQTSTGSYSTVELKNLHFVSNDSGVSLSSANKIIATGVLAENNETAGLWTSATSLYGNRLRGCGNGLTNVNGLGLFAAEYQTKVVWAECLNNGGWGFGVYAVTGSNLDVRNLRTGANAQAAYRPANDGVNLNFTNLRFEEATLYLETDFNASSEQFFTSTKHNGVTDSHFLGKHGGSVVSDSVTRHTATGISWNFRLTSLSRTFLKPLAINIAKIACAANVPLNLQIWTRRDNVNIKGTFLIRGGQLSGMPADVRVECQPAIDTWVQSDVLTVTPTESGVIEVEFEAYDGVGTTNNFWVDDVSIA